MRKARLDMTLLGLGAAAALTLFATAASAADVAHGKQIFASCAACHSERPDAIGPDLKGIVGRKSAAVDGYRYSAAMRRAHLVWDEANLKQYIANPQAKAVKLRTRKKGTTHVQRAGMPAGPNASRRARRILRRCSHSARDASSKVARAAKSGIK